MDTIDIQDLLEREVDLPAPVTKWEVEAGSDWSGDEAVWVWAYVDDIRLSNLSSEVRATLRRRIREAVLRIAKESVEHVYVRFRGASEALTLAV